MLSSSHSIVQESQDDGDKANNVNDIIVIYYFFSDTGMTSVSSVTYATVHYNQMVNSPFTKTKLSAQAATPPITRRLATRVVALSTPEAHVSSTGATTGTKSVSSVKTATKKSAQAGSSLRTATSTALHVSRMRFQSAVQGVANRS